MNDNKFLSSKTTSYKIEYWYEDPDLFELNKIMNDEKLDDQQKYYKMTNKTLINKEKRKNLLQMR